VLIHTWPYFDECAFLAHFHPNVYIDTCWLAVLSPSFLERALQTYIGFLPSHKLMLSHDATSIEMAVGSARLNRTLLAKTLASQVADGRVTVEQALSLSRAVLHGNARDVYAL
jgi:predicted TIM-barrel fold metal-dependent hydrolase